MSNPHYSNGERVEVAPDGRIEDLLIGTIIGKSSSHIIDMWIVKLDKPLPKELNYPYEAIPVQHTFIRKVGDNCPFLCEKGRFSFDIVV